MSNVDFQYNHTTESIDISIRYCHAPFNVFQKRVKDIHRREEKRRNTKKKKNEVKKSRFSENVCQTIRKGYKSEHILVNRTNFKDFYRKKIIRSIVIFGIIILFISILKFSMIFRVIC